MFYLYINNTCMLLYTGSSLTLSHHIHNNHHLKKTGHGSEHGTFPLHRYRFQMIYDHMNSNYSCSHEFTPLITQVTNSDIFTHTYPA